MHWDKILNVIKSLANRELNPKLIIQEIFACYNLLVMNLVQKNFALRKKINPRKKPRKTSEKTKSKKFGKIDKILAPYKREIDHAHVIELITWFRMQGLNVRRFWITFLVAPSKLNNNKPTCGLIFLFKEGHMSQDQYISDNVQSRLGRS